MKRPQITRDNCTLEIQSKINHSRFRLAFAARSSSSVVMWGCRRWVGSKGGISSNVLSFFDLEVNHAGVAVWAIHPTTFEKREKYLFRICLLIFHTIYNLLPINYVTQISICVWLIFDAKLKKKIHEQVFVFPWNTKTS